MPDIDNSSERNAEVNGEARAKLDRRFCIAPMMDCSDRHARYFLRLFSPRILLYTEMVTAAAIVHGDHRHLLEFNQEEHPLAAQLGGSDPEQLQRAAQICLQYGYDELNLNCGCPSDRVQSGQFGACLMDDPVLVAECVAALGSAGDVAVTVKHRTGSSIKQAPNCPDCTRSLGQPQFRLSSS